MEKKFHVLSEKETLALLGTRREGLDNEEAKRRLLKYGPNKIKEKEPISPLKIFLSQFQGFLVYLLFGAAILSFLIKEYIDGCAILAILVLNGFLGFIQEYKAEKAIEALKKLETPHAKVTREGKDIVIPAEEVVPGDILLLNEGDKVPADARLIESFYLQTDEAILTGESKPVNKIVEVLPEKTSLPDRKNLVFSGTLVTKGKGKAIVFSTGMETEVGKIATLVSETEEAETPLQMTLEKLGKTLGTICVVVALPGLIFGILKGREIVEMIMTAISLAVSAIPEGLPVVVTIALALGTRRMVKRGVLIRKLPAVEALGSTDVICSDKTGTITLNKMTVTDLVTPSLGLVKVKSKGLVGEFEVLGSGYSFLGEEASGTGIGKVNSKDLLKNKEIEMLVYTGILCNDSDLNFGDPTERSLLVLGEQLGISTEEEEKRIPRLDEVPFDSANKYMITLNKLNGRKISFLKGAPEVVLKACDSYQLKGERKKLTLDERKKIIKTNEELSARALRVLAMAYKEVTDSSDFKEMKGFTFLGLVGMIDPPREEVKEAVKTCHKAGIKVIMITGDHPLTAEAIAKEIGLSFGKVVTGQEIDKLKEKELEKLVEKETVFARVSPTHKLQILRALQKNKHLVAMTGDGVNDAPALKEANIGIAVGSGSDLAKEISDMILLDDNFATIAKGVYEGRGIFFNIKKFVKFLISANFDEILVILTSILFNFPLPFLPIHLLWLNLATDSLPALALSVDAYEPGLMEKKPYDPKKEILHGVLGFSIVAGILAYIASMGAFFREYFILKSPERMAQTVAFTVTVLFEFFLVFSCRSEKSAFAPGLFSNKFLLLAVFVGILMQMFAVYFPYTHQVFKTVPLDLGRVEEFLLFASLGFVVIEILRALKLNYFERDWKREQK